MNPRPNDKGVKMKIAAVITLVAIAAALGSFGWNPLSFGWQILSQLHPHPPSDGLPPSVAPPNALGKDAIRSDAVRAVAIAHGRGAGMSLLALFALVLEEGLPPRLERERMLAERLREDSGADDLPPNAQRRWHEHNRLGDTTSELLHGDTPNPSA